MESPLADDELIRRTKRGDREAFGALVRRYQEIAFRTAWVIVRDEQDAEDAAQAAFLNAWLAIDRFRPGAPFRPWLLRIVANEAKNRARSHQRHAHHAASDVEPDHVADNEMLPEHQAMARQQAAWLVGQINDLNDQDRTVIYYRYALDLPEAEIAVLLECARGTVKSRLHRALGRLRQRLETTP